MERGEGARTSEIELIVSMERREGSGGEFQRRIRSNVEDDLEEKKKKRNRCKNRGRKKSTELTSVERERERLIRWSGRGTRTRNER